MTPSKSIRSIPSDEVLPSLPMRKESYTTWLYGGLALASVIITILGFWIASAQVP
jgi:hypothetical protein